ncbi:MAG: hypothetical protein ACRDIV_17580 [Ktedonobacteraceae bacterium]
MGSTTVDRRKTNGVPGSDAEEQVKAMGGPVARRASRTPADGPAPMTFRQKIRSCSARQDAMEEPLDADVLPETEEDDEWEPVRSSRTEVRRRLAEQNARASQTVPERRTTGNPIPPRRRTDDLPRQRRHLSGQAALLVGALALIALYIVFGWLYSAWVGVSNRLSYGPTPTSYLEAVVGDHDAPGHPTWIVAMNEHGTIVLQVAPGGDFTKATTYVMQAQTTFHSWGNLDDIVITLTVVGSGPAPNILVHLQGDPDIGHFYERPSATFLLLNQQPGFKVGPFVDQ